MVVVVVVVVEDEVVNAAGSKAVGVCGKSEPEKLVDVVSSGCFVVAACVEVAVVAAVVGCTGAVVGSAWVVRVIVDSRLVVKGFVVGFSSTEPGLAEVLPAMVCNWSFSSRPEGSFTLVGVFVVVNACTFSSIVVFSEAWTEVLFFFC